MSQWDTPVAVMVAGSMAAAIVNGVRPDAGPIVYSLRVSW